MIQKDCMKFLILISLLIVVYASGCVSRDEIDERFATATEEYHMGWVLHNVNDSTPTELSYSLDELAIYNYTFNYPDHEPERFSNVFIWSSPVHMNSSSFEIEFRYQMSAPLNRTYFIKGENPVSQYYSKNWSLSNYMYINYVSDTDKDYMEKYKKIYPIPGKKKQISWGTAPFKPTGIKVSDNLITLTDHLIKGRYDNSYLFRDIWWFYSDEVPRYEIYLDGILVSTDTLDYLYYWDYSALNYSMIDDGTYLVKITIPTSYSVWDTVKIDARFTKPSVDTQPPLLNRIEARPYYNYNEMYEIKFNVSDDSGISNVDVYYIDFMDWTQLPLTEFSGVYNTSVNITSIIGSLEFMLSVTDTSNNQVNYTFIPLALPRENIIINITTDKTIRGGKLYVDGSIKNSYDYGIGGLRLEFFLNGSYADRSMTEIESRDDKRKGDFQVYLGDVSCDLSDDQNVSVHFSGTGVYPSNEVNESIEIVSLDFSVNDTVPIHDQTLIDASGSGASLYINKTDLNWTFNTTMSKDDFDFRPHNYGNYTIKLNTSCGESIEKSLFSNITTQPFIMYLSHYSYPMENDDIYVYVDIFSDGNHFLDGRVSNSTYVDDLNFLRYFYEYRDSITGEPYNSSYGYWKSTISGLSKGKYNLTANLTDIIGQETNATDELRVYPRMNISFNIRDRFQNIQNRTIKIHFGPYQEYSYYNSIFISGIERLLLPNVSFFRLPSHVSVRNDLGCYSYIFVAFLNSTIKKDMNLTSDYYEKDVFVGDEILHSIYTFDPSWNYNDTYLACYYSYTDTYRLNMHDLSKTTIYTCPDWNYESEECESEWQEATDITRDISSIIIHGKAGEIEALAVGEPQYCGDGYCSSSESCSSCPSDCGSCDTTIETTVTTIMGNGNDTSTTTSINTTSTTAASSTSTSSIATTIEKTCKNIGESCNRDTDCCHGYCCDEKCVEEECKKESGISTNIIMIVGILSVGAPAGYFAYTKFIKKKLLVKPKIPRNQLIGELKSLRKITEELRSKGYNVSKCQSELRLAEGALNKDLSNLAKIHLQKAKKILRKR